MDLKSALNPESLFATLADLIAINSVNPQYPGGPGEGRLAEYIGDYFRKNSIPFEYQTVFEGRPNVIAKLDGKRNGRTLVLEAHMDTASELSMSRAPFQPVREGNLLYGRGSCDTKGGLAAMLHAVKALRDAEVQLSTSAVLVAAVDEEHSFRGVVKFLEKGIKADGAIVAEPTDLDAVVASKGVLRWRLRTRGRAAHSSKPHLGINAVTKMARIIVAIEEKFPAVFQSRQHPLLGLPTLNVGVIQGGLQVNQVPDSCTIELDRRLLPGETKESVWNEFETLLSQLQACDPELEVEMDEPMLEDCVLETDPSERIVQVISRVLREVTGHNHLVGVPYGSDASKLARAGIPSVILGPGNINQAHAAVEYVDLDQVALAAEVYARSILEF
jgi:acetylornithine deacetylase/succinyl-diaminopimelate desuccinylase family protein